MKAWTWKGQMRHVAFVLAFTGLTGLQPALSSGPDRICAPDASGWGNPTLDGVVEAIGKPATQPPNVGYIAGDQGWNQAHRVNLFRDDLAGSSQNPAVTSDAFVQLLKSDYDTTTKEGTLWIAVWVDRAPAVDNAVVVGIAGNENQHGSNWILQIKPFCDTNCPPQSGEIDINPDPSVPKNVWNKNPIVKVWHSDSMSGTPLAGTWADQSLTQNIRAARSENRWSLEIKVPYTTDAQLQTQNGRVYIPTANQFRLYVNVLSTANSHVGAFVVQRPWPHNLHFPGGVIELNTPPVASWGIASLNGLFSDGASCRAVEIATGNFGVRNSLPANNGHQIQATPGAYSYNGTPITDVEGCKLIPDNYAPSGSGNRPNIFWARPTNFSAARQAKDVNADFYIADWGISADWTKLGSLASPTPGVPNATPGSDVTLGTSGNTSAQQEVTTTWDLSYKQSCLYSLTGNIGAGHHCVQVILRSNNPETAFSQRSAIDNFDFVGLSQHERTATLSTRGMGPVPTGQATHRMLLISRKDVINYRADGKVYYAATGSNGNGYVPAELSAVPAARFPGPVSTGYLWIVDGFLLNGRKLIINGTPYEDTDYVSSFGYLGGHNGIAANRMESLIGPDQRDLPMVSEGVQVAQIPADSSIQITTRIEANDSPRACQCGDWKCLIEKQQNASTQTNLFAGTLALFGTLSVGGFAFLGRRKRPDEYLLGKDKE